MVALPIREKQESNLFFKYYNNHLSLKNDEKDIPNCLLSSKIKDKVQAKYALKHMINGVKYISTEKELSTKILTLLEIIFTTINVLYDFNENNLLKYVLEHGKTNLTYTQEQLNNSNESLAITGPISPMEIDDLNDAMASLIIIAPIAFKTQTEDTKKQEFIRELLNIFNALIEGLNESKKFNDETKEIISLSRSKNIIFSSLNSDKSELKKLVFILIDELNEKFDTIKNEFELSQQEENPGKRPKLS